jgi:hypothetical protein
VKGAKIKAVLDGMDLSQNLQTVLYVFSPVHTARSGQESLAQGSPWVSLKRCLALKGREIRRNSTQVASRFSPCLTCPFRADSGGGNSPRVNPGLCFAGRFGPRIYKIWKYPNRRVLTKTKIGFWPQRTTLNTCFQNNQRLLEIPAPGQ